MKVLVATDKPFAKVAVDGIRKEIEAAGYELALLEKYGDKAKLLEAVKDANAIIIRSDIIDAEVLDAAKELKIVVRAGAGLFVLAYNIFPYFQNVASFSYLMGASASVMAIVFAVSFYRKDLEINLFLIGRIKLIYLAIFTLVIDLLAMTSDNAGGHIAHIGGALFGMWFASRIRNGKDLTAPMKRLIDWFVNLGKRKPKMRVTYKRNETDYEYNARKHQESVDLDTILDKLKRSGYESLSAEEKKRLFDASKK